MRKFSYLVILLFAGLLPRTGIAQGPFTMLKDKALIQVKSAKLDGVTFSKECESKACQAWKVFKSPKSWTRPASKLRGNPASKHCKAQGGKGIILRDAKKRQYDFCLFKDGSMVDAWGLYESR